MASNVGKANPNLLAIIGFLLILGGGFAYISLPPGGDRGFLIIIVVPIATALLGGTVIGGHLQNQDAQLNTIQRQTNGQQDQQMETVAHRAAARALVLHERAANTPDAASENP